MHVQPQCAPEDCPSSDRWPAGSPTAPDGEAEFRAPLEQLLGAVVSLSGATAAAVRLHESDTHELRLVGAVGIPASLWQDSRRVADSCGVCGDAVRSLDPRGSPEACNCARAVGRGAGTAHRVSVVPLHYRGATCGVLNLFLPAGCQLPDSLAPLLAALGNMLGLSLENALLTQKNLQASLTHERHMLANEVHDSLAQNLASMRMRTTLLYETLQRHDDTRAFKYLGEVHDALAVCHRRVRELITHFRSQMDPEGLIHAIGEAGATFAEFEEVDFAFDNQVPDLHLSPDQEMQVYHIVREALANIAKHARARHCRVSLVQQCGNYVVTVEDDGVGLAANREAIAEHGHFGLNIMRERAERLGGRLQVESRAGAGTRIRLAFPATTPEGRPYHE